ncbi:30S ribosomal protein S4 [Methanofervidicoccus sp. A16]|uniref:30S ribosomal protein S4 n=1 Tax=Methanofervidicoccus sp. A16 TaxID=2607662 RepID=UPI00118C4AD4|nr:30S ribosomal protein S4 [Methanofervidicoccus sp. A16]AXI24764.1 30S ribosomal protein S4 [Methanofervidicoccus sp. A16]
MGDPRRLKKKYDTPNHPWIGERIKREKELLNKYGLVNKRELWKMETRLRKFRRQARKLISDTSKQGAKEAKQLFSILRRYGILVKEDPTLDDVLSLTVEDILERRLQTIVFRKGLARTIKQARQFIVHGHIAIKGRRVTAPSYLVPVDEEDHITYAPTSPLASKDHPERVKVVTTEEGN